MACEDLSDFEHEMYRAVVDESPLSSVPYGVAECFCAQGRHGPWEPVACSAQLLRWFDLGLVTLYDAREGHPTNRPDVPGPPATRQGPTGLLTDRTARERLMAWAHWDDDDEEWFSLRLVVTDRGRAGLDALVGSTVEGDEPT